MKKISFIAILLIIFTLSACTSTVTSETGYDLTDLNVCVDDMVDEVSSAACDKDVRNSLMEAYVQSFESEYDVTGTNLNTSDFEFSSNKASDEVRLEYWFQYSALPDVATNNYTTFKDIIKTMMLDMREINALPEFLITGEFFVNSNNYFIFRTDKDDALEGEIQVHRSTSIFSDVLTEAETFLDTYGIDTDLKTQIVDILASDYAVYIVVDVAAQEYQYKVYRETSDVNLSLSEVEALVETALNDESLTKVAWTID